MEKTLTRRRLLAERIRGVTVVSFLDDRIVSDDVIEEVGDELFKLVDEEKPRNLLLNFGHVQYFSSTALGKLLTLRKKVATLRGKLKFCCVHPDLLELFRLHRPKGAEPIFEIYDEERQAIDTF